jgi:exopolysaccharide biosynthesis polyprenyl glycosylphosphotransferase
MNIGAVPDVFALRRAAAAADCVATPASRRSRNRILILGSTPLAAQIVHEIDRHAGTRWQVIGVVDDNPGSEAVACRRLGPTSRLNELVDREKPDRVIVALSERRGRTPIAALVESCVAKNVRVEDGAEFYERLTGKLAIESLTPTSIVFSNHFRSSPLHRLVSRAISLMAAVVGLLCLGPLMGLVAVAIKLDSPGPVLFVQLRAGAHGRPFRLLKFRTMRVTGARRSEWEGDNRDRVTRVGRVLRACRLDELPQFVNILRGEMNLVGPRPHPVSNLALFTLVARNLNELTGAAVDFYALRSMVRPGITGWAQTRYGYANSLEEEIEKLRYDLYYVKYFSSWLDLRILLRTVLVIVKGYSISEAPGTASGASVGTLHLTRRSA